MSLAAIQASTPPTAVMATMARKMGLGRTDWCTGRMLTSRNYRDAVFQSQPVSSADSSHSRRAIAGSSAFSRILVTFGLPNWLSERPGTYHWAGLS